MTEPTARDLLVCVEMNNARIRGPDGASARVLAAYREELLAASAQSAEPQEEEVLLDIRHRLYAEAVERSVGWSAWTPNEAYKTGFEGGIDATFDILRARLAMKRHLAAPAQSVEPQEAEEQRHEIRFIDATPDEGYIRRILEAYIDDSYYSDNTAGLPPENEVCKMMNKWREERNALLRAVLARLASKPSRSEEMRPVQDGDLVACRAAADPLLIPTSWIFIWSWLSEPKKWDPKRHVLLMRAAEVRAALTDDRKKT